jgi:hypothetical protein
VPIAYNRDPVDIHDGSGWSLIYSPIRGRAR